ncbi:N-acetyltransferase [Paractinoplanes abujensis]|uniref:GNAT superfamily N-acetyltransferase n=1 Tax=Paractinoplanes abujensis TaxID=882441 RepID=A0A7W7D2I5_9ACTN|nr:GNAT family N-acetyltransferase [Actinoplanes abujensis]MBB4697803.1 GNAT superfamily N-acetyltransferase [Actinoplanes abujensis]GID19711.1 N-acetyltransferase [Actinoplanes abujensis]
MITWVGPPGDTFEAVAALFDEYRVHYGFPSAPHETQAWLAEQVTSGRFAVAAAIESGTVRGFVTTAVLPASLTLGTAWLVRDLFVPPRARRRGVARALLAHVVTAARSAGARRVSLQTEADNEPALTLYAEAGFRPVTGLDMLNLTLT